MNARPWLKIVSVLVGLYLTVPTLVVIPMSFSSSQTFRFPPAGWSLQWYERLFTSPEWSTAILNSVQIGLLTTVLATTLGTAAALGLGMVGTRARGLATGFLLSPIIIPNILIALVIFSAFLRLSLTGSLVGIALAHTAIALPFVVIAVTARLQGMDAALEKAGTSLGAGPLSVFRKITLPLALPGVLSGAILAFITSFDEVVIALFLQSPSTLTLPVQMFNSVTVQIDPTISAASSLMVMLVSVPILLAQVIGARRGKAGRK